MGKASLNSTLLNKIAKKTNKSPQYIREQISKKAGKLGISSLAAQFVYARNLGVTSARALNKAPAEVREEVRGAISNHSGSTIARATPSRHEGSIKKKLQPINNALINGLIHDKELRGRCRDLILAGKHYDRVFREATTVLDHRLKKKAGITKMNPEALVAKVLNPDPAKAVIVVSNEGDEQKGFFSMCNGVMLAFRNKSHHSLTDIFTKEEALKFCGFIDVILLTIEQATLHLDRV